VRLRVSGFLNTRVIEIVSDTAAVIWLRIAQTGVATQTPISAPCQLASVLAASSKGLKRPAGPLARRMDSPKRHRVAFSRRCFRLAGM